MAIPRYENIPALSSLVLAAQNLVAGMGEYFSTLTAADQLAITALLLGFYNAIGFTLTAPITDSTSSLIIPSDTFNIVLNY